MGCAGGERVVGDELMCCFWRDVVLLFVSGLTLDMA